MDDLVAELEAVVPDVTVTVEHPGFVRRLFGGLAAGNTPGPRIVIADEAVAAPPFVVAVPDVADLVVAPIAQVIRVTVDVRRRFGPALAHLRSISFDFSDRELETGGHAGHALHNTSSVHLSASYVIAERAAALLRKNGVAMHPVASVIAHELWHIIELAWQTRDYRETVGFRRDIGAYFGEETIERVMSNPVARDRLAREVSMYATTNAREATAEMFEQWWTSGTEKPAIAHFGTTVERYFPV